MFYKARGVNLKETTIKTEGQLYQPCQRQLYEEVGGHYVCGDIFDFANVNYVNST
jgi:hypothetical protein